MMNFVSKTFFGSIMTSIYEYLHLIIFQKFSLRRTKKTSTNSVKFLASCNSKYSLQTFKQVIQRVLFGKIIKIIGTLE